MVCPFCLYTKTQVYNSRVTKKINEIWRRRRCSSCHKEFTTHEHTDPGSVIKVALGTKKVPFLRNTLLLSMLRACDHRTDDDIIFYLAETVQQHLYNLAAKHNQLITPRQITQTVSQVLEHFDPLAYVKYNATSAKSADLAKFMRKRQQKDATF